MPPLTPDRLIEALSESSLVKACAIMDRDGQIQATRGEAKVFELNTPAPIKKPTENVYLVELEADILMVVFDEHIEFERLRKSVDTLIEHHGMAKKSAPGER